MVEEPKGPHKQVKLNVRVPPNLKQRWKDATDDGETLKDLVVRAVNREIDNEYIHVEHVEEQSVDAEDIDFSSIEERLSGIEGELTELRADVNETVRPASETPDELTEDELENLAADVHNYVPLVDDVDKFCEQEVPLLMSPKDRAPVTGFLEDITLAVNDLTDIEDFSEASESDLKYKRIHVREALMYLQNQTTARIESIVDETGKRRWYEAK